MSSNLPHKTYSADHNQAIPDEFSEVLTKRIKTTGSEARIYDVLESITEGSLTVKTPGGQTYNFGEPLSNFSATMIINDVRAFSRILNGTSLGLGESYMEGLWDAEDDNVSGVLGILLKNEIYNRMRFNPILALRILIHRVLNLPTTISRAKKCISHHYDLSNEFYSLFLDTSMTYSCGYQLTPFDSLALMQSQKNDLICQKLNMHHGASVIDIGSGWGAFLMHAAKKYGANGVGITLSEKQHSYCRDKFENDEIRTNIHFDLKDYRETAGLFDHVVSVGMFEHVGLKCYPEFMEKIASLLKNGGTGMLQTIGLTDDSRCPADPWIEKYIFPGGRIPRLEEIVREMQKVGLVIAHVENLKLHYAATLRHWKKNFDKNSDKIRALGPEFDNRFMRMWNYYLQACEAAFRYSTVQLYQVTFCKQGTWPFPTTFNNWL